MAAGSVAPERLNRGVDATCGAPRSALNAAVPLVLLWSIALALVSRRLAGALVQPLSSGVLLACAAAVCVASLMMHRTIATLPVRRPFGDLLQLLATLALALMAWSVSLPGSSVVGLFLLWAAAIAPVVAGQLATVWLRRAAWPVAAGAGSLSVPAPAAAPSLDAIHQALPNDELRFPSIQEEAAEHELADEGDPFDDRILQQLTRLRNDDGADAVEGWCRVTLSAGQRQATSHLAFCPPLDRVPTIEVEQLDGPAARIKVGQSLPHGARIELKLVEAMSESSQVLLRFRAS